MKPVNIKGFSVEHIGGFLLAPLGGATVLGGTYREVSVWTIKPREGSPYRWFKVEPFMRKTL